MKSHDPLQLLRAERRRRLLLLPLVGACAGLLVAAALYYFVDWGLWARALGVTITVTLFLLVRGRRDLPSAAREIDARLSTKARLEAAAEMEGMNGPLAAAQRAETTRALGALQPRRFPWVGALATIAAALLILHGWIAGSRIVFARAPEPPKAEVKKPDAPNPTAEIVWKAPEAESKAAPLDEVPLTAEAVSSSGLHDLVLQVAVNGEARKSIALPADPFGEKGAHPLEASLYLDELEVEPFDMISYHVEARRVSGRPLPKTASALQFVQVRPFRDDAVKGMSFPGVNEANDVLAKLKVAQLGLMKQNFFLANAEVEKTAAVWLAENERVASDQTKLAPKTEEAIEFFISKGMPAVVIDLLKQAVPRMAAAGEAIGKKENAGATPDQGKALALITECEKVFVKMVKPPVAGKPKPEVKDPFKDKQKFEMPPREETPAGQLELAAKEQKELLDEVSAEAESEGAEGKGDKPKPGEGEKPKPGEGGKGDGGNGEGGAGEKPKPGDGGKPGKGDDGKKGLGDRQRELEKKLEALAKEEALSEKVKEAVARAKEAAKEAAEDLEARDTLGATEPAGRAAEALKEAVATMESEGAKAAAEALASAQRELNEAASEAKKGEESGQGEGKGDGKGGKEAAAKADGAASGLQAAAKGQQQGGSAEAAKALAEAAKEIQASMQGKGLPPGKGSKDGNGKQPASTRLRVLAQMTAAEQARLLARQAMLDRAAQDLKRGMATLSRLAELAAKPDAGDASDRREQAKLEALAQVEDAAQRAAAMLAGDEARAQAASVQERIDAASGTGKAEDPPRAKQEAEALRAPVQALIDLIAAAARAVDRDEVVARFDPENAPEAYRESVADYFEQLSRDYERAKSEAEAK